MTIAYTVASVLFTLVELNVISQLLGWNVSARAGIANLENYLIWDEASESVKRALQLQQYWNTVGKGTLCGVVISTIVSSDPLVRCVASIMISLGVTQYHFKMRPVLLVMEQEEEVSKGQHKAIDFLVVVLFITFAVIAVLEGLDFARISNSLGKEETRKAD
jgi:hypothetical protein